MSDSCCSLSKPILADLDEYTMQLGGRETNECPTCRQRGRPVPGQTVKAMLAVTLRQVRDTEYFFCRTPDCPVVYFSADGTQTFSTDEVRERVFQKEPDADAVFVCYCFQHTVGDVSAATPELRDEILDDINVGISAGQCACDLRNPQGACCLGNVRQVMKQFEHGKELALR
jgi:hypothetical protein